MIVVALYATRVLASEEALSGFSSEPAIVVAGIFVLSGAMHATGLSNSLGKWIGRLAGESYSRAILVIMPAVALMSAFTHHVTTTAVMLPVVMDLSRERKIPASKRGHNFRVVNRSLSAAEQQGHRRSDQSLPSGRLSD